MRPRYRAVACAACALLAFGAVLAEKPPRRRSDHDAFGSGRRPATRPEPVAPERGQVREGTRPRMEERLGVPTFLWAGERGRHESLGPFGHGGSPPDPREAARGYLRGYAPMYRLEPADVEAAKIRGVHDTGRGAIIVSFYQEVDGIEVFRDAMKLAMTRDRDLVAIAGYLTRPQVRSRVFRLDGADAVAAALDDLTDYGFAPRDLHRMGRRPADGPYARFILSPRVEADSGFEAPEPLRARQVWFRLPDGLEPAWQTECTIGSSEQTDALHYGHIVSAVDGRILLRRDFTVSDSFTYRVWADPNDASPYDGPQGTSPTPHPTGYPDGFQPAHVPQQVVVLESGPIGTGDPWLGTGATETVGNNVDAYADLVPPDGFDTGDLRASTTSADTFDRIYDTTMEPDASTQQRRAAITQLFYTNNWLHDAFYDAGFDEASGNAQADNYGRGGMQGDNLRAEGQDYTGRNNANMATPPDGFRPRMQMYIFDGLGLSGVTVNSPAPIAATYDAGGAAFGPQVFDLTDDVALVNDGVVDPNGGTATDGCEVPFVNGADIAGRIALIDRGLCTFALKVQNAQSHGAVGVVIANHQPGVIPMGGNGAVSIPSLLVSQSDGNTFKANLPTLNVTLFRTGGVTDRDGTIDNQIVAHEWGHFISNRLVGNAFGLNTNMASGLGEGWGDFHGLMMTVRREDANAPGGADFAGAYALAGYALTGQGTQGYYFGIRRAPLSTDPTINPLTFRHIEEGVPLPTTAPIAFGHSGAGNAEVHNTGEIWANMLWECYASLLRDTLDPMPRLTFDEARRRMQDYLVAGYKMTPNSPTLLEARDALLVAALANDPVDYQSCWAAFATRGAGVGAVAPDRYSSSNSGVVESYLTGGALALTSIDLADDLATDCFPDGVLDNGETGSLTVTLLNTGSDLLAAATGTILANHPAVSFPSGNTVLFPPTGPFASSQVVVPVIVGGAAGIAESTLTVEVDDPGLVSPGPVAASGSFLLNADEIPEASASDGVDGRSTVWMIGNDPGLDTSQPFRRIQISGLDHRWLGPDTGSTSDQFLVSPPLQVAATGNFVVSFDHRFDFETSEGVWYDGGVVELSDDGGASWVDIGTFVTDPNISYVGTIAIGGSNPLEGRPAFSGRNLGYPDLDGVSIHLGTTYQGQTVLVRFRIGTDVFVGAPGWEIDNISFSGITNTPFSILVPHDSACDADEDMVVDTADCAPSDPSIWGAPAPIPDLAAAPLPTPGDASFSWTEPTDPGGIASPTYDAVVSTAASGFLSGLCLESNETDRVVVTTGAPPPGGIEYILVGARSACGRSFAPDSTLAARSVTVCMP